jgi:hypothetical protein
MEPIDDHFLVGRRSQNEIPVAARDAVNPGARLEAERGASLADRVERDVSDLHILVTRYLREGAHVVVTGIKAHCDPPSRVWT